MSHLPEQNVAEFQNKNRTFFGGIHSLYSHILFLFVCLKLFASSRQQTNISVILETPLLSIRNHQDPLSSSMTAYFVQFS